MKIESQVCTLEQAKKLKELGIDQETEFYFRMGKVWHFREVTDWPNQEQLSDLIQSRAESERIFAAYTVAELGEMLPHEYLRSDIDKDFEMQHGRGVWPTGSGWGARVERASGGTKFFPTEAEARAFLLISLIESNLITVEEINTRLK